MNDKKELIAQFRQKTVLIVGDVMIDSYWIGQVNRISPEAPVPVVNLKKKENRLGGAANVALNIKSLGGNAILCSIVGDDDNGELFRSIMKSEQLDLAGIISSQERKTTIKSRVFSAGQQLLRLDEEDTHYLSQDEETRFLSQIDKILENTPIDVILFQDYNKGVLTKNVIKKLIAFSRKRAIKTVVDPKSINFYAYEGVTLFKPNLKEISEAVGFRVKAEMETLLPIVTDLRAQIGSKMVMVTLSEKGLFVMSEEGAMVMPTTTKSVADVSGAGDTVISVIALGLAVGANLKQIAELSNKAAGVVCAKLGVVPISAQELLL